MSIETRFRAHLARNEHLVPAGSRVLIGLSGGPDSMALLNLLLGLRARLGLHILAAHFDHRARTNSAAEAREVGEWAASLGVPCRVGRPKQRLRDAHADWRHARYAFLHSAARIDRCARIATAHHEDDQVETVLFRLIRGTGTAGLAGIPGQRRAIVRPLLPFRRSELQAYIDDRGIPHHRDPSNADPRWARARIRWQVRPALESSVRLAGGSPGAATQAILRVAEQAGRLETAFSLRDEEILTSVLLSPPQTSPFRLDYDGVRALSAHDRSRLVRLLARRLDTQLTAGGTRAAAEFISHCGSGGSIDIGGGLWLRRSFDELVLGRERKPTRSGEAPVEIRREGEGTAIWAAGHRRFRVSWGTANSVSAVADYCIALPQNPEHYPMKLRSWSPGDRIRTRAGTRKLKKVFGECRVGVEARVSVPLLASHTGRILWAADVAYDQELVAAAGAPTNAVRNEQRLLRLSEEER